MKTKFQWNNHIPINMMHYFGVMGCNTSEIHSYSVSMCLCKHSYVYEGQKQKWQYVSPSQSW